MRRAFTQWADVANAMRLRHGVVCERRGQPLPMHPRLLGGTPVWCRPGTADWRTLLDTFAHQYHAPRDPLTDPAWIVDLGANVGYTAAHYLYAYPSARVLAVEMDRDNHDLALRNLAPWERRFTLVNAAIWSSDGEVEYGGAREDAYRVIETAGGPAPGRLGH
ncbi:MAG: hypothetical protein FJX75_15725 [Armatimonadetes bacterium]|nr:hypothetical protein [Armatimonadota bacterium]